MLNLIVSQSHLFEEAPGELLLEHPFLRDVVKEILAGLGPLHHDDVGVVAFKVVEQPDDPLFLPQHRHQADLQRHSLLPDLGEGRKCAKKYTPLENAPNQKPLLK